MSYRSPQSRPRRLSAVYKGGSIPDIFKRQALSKNGGLSGKMAPTRALEDFSNDSQSAAEDNTRGPLNPNLPLTYADMFIFAADIKSTFSAAITDLKSNLLVLNDKMASVEAAGKQREKAIRRLERVTISHSNHFIEMYTEDLDNRGRRCNIRVRGIPESVEPDQITLALQRMFNRLLEKPEDSEIEFVRAHRALRARGPDNQPPRDVICCLQSFALKEEIMQKARRNDRIVFNGETIMLFQDLSQITLKKRRALRPLLEELRNKGMRYTWRFTFALLVTHNGRQFALRSPDDLEYFCSGLQLNPMELPDWYQEYRLPPPDRSPPMLTTCFTRREKHQADETRSPGGIYSRYSRYRESSLVQGPGQSGGLTSYFTRRSNEYPSTMLIH